MVDVQFFRMGLSKEQLESAIASYERAGWRLSPSDMRGAFGTPLRHTVYGPGGTAYGFPHVIGMLNEPLDAREHKHAGVRQALDYWNLLFNLDLLAQEKTFRFNPIAEEKYAVTRFRTEEFLFAAYATPRAGR